MRVGAVMGSLEKVAVLTLRVWRPMNAAARVASLLNHGARCSSQGESPSDHVDSCEMRSPNLKERNETG